MLLLATPLSSAAETRRRELPATCAIVILTGGLAAAIMHSSGAVLWAGIVALLLIADAELYRRLDDVDAPISGWRLVGLAGWAFATSSFYAALPAALWFSGQAAGAAAAMVLWVAGVVRQFSAGPGRVLSVALAGAAPPALSLLLAPFAMALADTRPDWDAAFIAAVGGGALMIYVAQARIAATEAEQKLRDASADQDIQSALAHLLYAQGGLNALLVDTEGAILAISPSLRRGLEPDGAEGRKFEDVFACSPERWRVSLRLALRGETSICGEDEAPAPPGMHGFLWEARPWRTPDNIIRGALVLGRAIAPTMEIRVAPAPEPAHLASSPLAKTA